MSDSIFMLKNILNYFVAIKPGRLVLWCYLIWYCVTVIYHFDPSIKLWINSIGICVVIGTALILSVSREGLKDPWQVFRLFWMPFAVSSFAALIKNQGFIIIFSPNPTELTSAIGACCLFLGAVFVIKKLHPFLA